MTNEEFHKRLRALCDKLIEAGQHYREEVTVLMGEVLQKEADGELGGLDMDFIEITIAHEETRVRRALEQD